MSQFSVVDKVDFFKKISELICSDLIATSVSKDKLYREYKKLENKLKTEAAKKKAMQIKKAELDKKILEQNKETGSNNMTLLLQKRDTQIHNLKKKLEIPNDGHLQTTELKTILEEKESLQQQLLDSKATIATFTEQKKVLEDQIKLLKEQVDQISSFDPDFTVASDLGKLSVKDLELEKMQDELHLAKQEVQEKHKLLTEPLADRDGLQEHVDSAKRALIEAKTIIWNHICREVKKVRDYLILLDEEKELTSTCMKNASLMLENMGDKLTLAQNVINFLNFQNKARLQIVGVTNRFDLLVQAKKYVIKDSLEKEGIAKSNHLIQRAQDFKTLFKDVFNQGLPFFWTEEGMLISEVNYLTKLQEKAKDTSVIDNLDPIVKGREIFQVLDKISFCFMKPGKLFMACLLPPTIFTLTWILYIEI